MNRIRKIYVIGPQKGYASWIPGKLTNIMDEADLVVLTGGEDINPAIYNDNVGKHTYFNNNRDLLELKELDKAINLSIPIWGTCRGAQLLCAIAGGKLVQDLSHPSQHPIKFMDGTEAYTTSCHHQLQHPFNLEKSKYEILAYAEGLSNIYLNGNDENMLLPSNDENIIIEPEFVYYRELNALGIQGHPEWMDYNSKLTRILRKYIDFQLDKTLEMIINLKIPINRLISYDFKLNEDEIQLYNQLQTKKSITNKLELVL